MVFESFFTMPYHFFFMISVNFSEIMSYEIYYYKLMKIKSIVLILRISRQFIHKRNDEDRFETYFKTYDSS